MRSIKVALLLAAAVCAFASTAVAASAAEWKVEGKVLSGKEAISPTTKVVEDFTLASAGVTITCTGLEDEGGFIEAPNKNGATALVFKGCEVTEGACKVSETLKTNAVKSTAEGKTITFEPTSGTNFITIDFEGSECALKGKKEVTGKVKVSAPTGETEETEQELVADSTELKVGTNPATFKGKAKVKLTSGKTFSD
jgi:hypothetical protein